MVDEKLITERKADAAFAGFLRSTTSETRQSLDAILPRGTGALPTTSVPQFVRQNRDGSWPNPVTDANVNGRIWVGLHDSTKRPTFASGVREGDVLAARDGVFIAGASTVTGAATWTPVASGTGTTPTDPTDPTDPVDPTPASPTSRPQSVIGTTGVWTTTGGSTLVTALSDQHLTSAAAAPVSGANAVGLVVQMTPFAHVKGNDLTVVLWGARSTQPGEITVSLGVGGTAYVSSKSKTISDTEENITFTWPDAEQLALTTEQWKRLELTVTRSSGGISNLADITMQSSPASVVTPPGSDPTQPTSVLWASNSIWYSDLTAAPLSKSNAAISAYVRGQATSGAFRLDCYADAAPIWGVPSTAQRVNITPPATSTRGDVNLMRRTDGKGALDGVPIPAGFTAPSNLFKTAIVTCVETKQVWELLGLTGSGSAWAAQWGGRIDDVPASGGAFPVGTGYTGSGLSFTAAAIKVAEAKDAAAGNARAIPHAIGLNLNYDSGSSQFCWPATRSDGTSSDPGAPLAGQRVRLKASADLSGCTPLGKAVGEALKRYGAVIMGGAEKIGFLCESGAVEQAKSGIDPWGAILNGKTVDTVLAGIPLAQLEVVSPGWGGPGWKEETETTTPTVPTDPTPPVAGARRQIYMPPGIKWLSGASCRGIENSADGMSSPFAQWRGEPCHFMRVWSDDGGPGDTKDRKTNDPNIAAIWERFGNFHASADIGPGFFGTGESMSAAANGSYRDRWIKTLQTARRWWSTRKDPSKVNVFFSPAHEMNGSWYHWSVNNSNVGDFIRAWKLYRQLQLQYFPECFMTFNVNHDSSFYSGTVNSSGKGMDWRRMVPGWTEGGASEVKKWVDVGAVDYYNMDHWARNDAEWAKTIMDYDGWGGPMGIERHRQFWESCGLPMTIPEWSDSIRSGDSPSFATNMNNFMRTHSGTGPGKICADALFNLSSGYEANMFAVMGDTVKLVNFAARYRSLNWGW